MLANIDLITTQFFSQDECNQVISYAHDVENYFKSKEKKHIDIVSENQITTSRFNDYNFFADNPQYVNRLSDKLKLFMPWLVRPLLLQSWVNIYRKGEGIKWHNHAGSTHHSYTANIFVGGDVNPGITFMEPGIDVWTLPNNIGEMMILNCGLYHSVRPNESDIPRYTVGMTIHDYHAMTPEMLSGAAVNSNRGQLLIL